MRPIDGDALKIHVCNMCDDGQRECKGDNSCAILRWVNDMPTVQPEVRHGRWIFKKGDNKECVDGWICTNCKYGFHTKVPYFEVFKYCPMCGARMDATDTNVDGKGGNG